MTLDEALKKILVLEDTINKLKTEKAIMELIAGQWEQAFYDAVADEIYKKALIQNPPANELSA